MINRITALLLFMGLAHWSCEDETELLTDCPENEICGCTNSSATNFDDTATFDDGSCEYIVGDVQANGCIRIILAQVAVRSIAFVRPAMVV